MTNATVTASSPRVAARRCRYTPRAFLAFPPPIPFRALSPPDHLPLRPAASLLPLRLPVRGVMADRQRPARTRTIRVTLVGLLLVPLLALVGLWAFAASITLGNVIRYQHYTTLAHTTSASIGALTGDLAAERSLTLAWVGSGRRTPQTALLAARHATDTAARRAARRWHRRAHCTTRSPSRGSRASWPSCPACPGYGRRPTRERPASSPRTAPTTRSARPCGSSCTSRRRRPTPRSAP